MRRFRLGMRWWLALAFASIAALTSLVVAGNALHSSSQSLRGHAQDLAIGNSVGASNDLVSAIDKGTLNQEIKKVAAKRRLSLFAFDRQGSPVTSSPSYGVDLPKIPSRVVAVSTALGGDRFIHSAADGSSTLVALPLRRHGVAVMLAYSPRPDVATELDIVKRSIVESALMAVGIGAVAGIVVAILIVRRLRRIGAAARAIAARRLRGRAQAAVAGRARRARRDDRSDAPAPARELRSLASEHHRLEGLLERLHEGVVLVDRDLSVGYANGAARRILGVDSLCARRSAARPVARAVAANARRRPLPRGAIAFEARATPDAEHTYSVVGIPVEQGVETTVLVLTDVSERERREAPSASSSRTRRTSCARRWPRSAGAVEVLQSGAKDDPVERDRFLGHIERECARLTRLGRAMLVLARAQTGTEAPRLGRVPLRGLLDEVAASLRPFDGVTVTRRVRRRSRRRSRTATCSSRCSSTSPQTRHATPTAAASCSRHARTAGTSSRSSYATRAAGISREHRDRIFDRFYRGGNRDGDGFGLGLAIVRASVQALGGTVEIESEPDSGTTARIVILSAVNGR